MSAAPRGAAVGFLAFGVFYLTQALRFPLGSVAQPGPGVFPLVVGGALLATGVALTAQSWRQRATAAWAPLQARWRVGAVAGALAGFCLLVEWLGYGLTAFGLMVVTLRIFGLTRWSLLVGAALLATVGSYYLFAIVLGVPLPAPVWSR